MELLTCPCCGGLAEIESTPAWVQVQCLDCALNVNRPNYGDLADVIAAWNRRVTMGFRKLDPRQ